MFYFVYNRVQLCKFFFRHKLFDEHFEEYVINSLINNISTDDLSNQAPGTGVPSKEIITKICRYIDCLLQVDIIYETNFLDKLKLKSMQCIKQKLTKLEDDVDILVCVIHLFFEFNFHSKAI